MKLFGKAIIAGFGGSIGVGIGVVIVSFAVGRITEVQVRRMVREHTASAAETLRKMREGEL